MLSTGSYLPEKIVTNADLEDHPDLLPAGSDPGESGYRLLLSVGHDEYWSGPMRDTVEAFVAASLLDVHLETGRTHQIRVHFAALRHPDNELLLDAIRPVGDLLRHAAVHAPDEIDAEVDAERPGRDAKRHERLVEAGLGIHHEQPEHEQPEGAAQDVALQAGTVIEPRMPRVVPPSTNSRSLEWP